MDYDTEKVDEMTLALMFLGCHDRQYGLCRAWKSFDWDAMDRLCEKGLISDPKSKARSVVLSEEGMQRCEELFRKHFGRPDGEGEA